MGTCDVAALACAHGPRQDDTYHCREIDLRDIGPYLPRFDPIRQSRYPARGLRPSAKPYATIIEKWFARCMACASS